METPTNEIFYHLLDKKVQNVSNIYEIRYRDAYELALLLTKNPFGDECTYCLDNKNIKLKSFSIQSKKQNIKKIFIHNYIGNLISARNIKTTCEDGYCCCVKHLEI